jgi:hypothetical protein
MRFPFLRNYIALFVLVSCVLQPLKNPPSPKDEGVYRSPKKSVMESRIIDSGPDSGIHVQIRIRTAEIAEPSSYLMRWSRSTPATILRYIEWKPGEDFQFIDRQLNPGERYIYALVQDPAQYVIHPRLSTSVLIPLNLEIPEDSQLSLQDIAEKYPDSFGVVGGTRRLILGNLRLYNNASLLTGGSDWWIHIRHLESQSARIESWEGGRQAVRGMEGRSSGSVLLDIEEGHGNLDLVSRGEAGGKGWDGFPGVKGRPGIPGRAAIVITDDRRSCGRRAEWGDFGRAGGNGTDGGPGGRGGDSKTFSLRMSRRSSSDLQVKFLSEAGKGGAGGVGGLGGRGGEKRLGRNEEPCSAPKTPPILRAKDGLAGKDGLSGGDGKASGVLCLANENGAFRPSCFDPSVDVRD